MSYESVTSLPIFLKARYLKEHLRQIRSDPNPDSNKILSYLEHHREHDWLVPSYILLHDYPSSASYATKKSIYILRLLNLELLPDKTFFIPSEDSLIHIYEDVIHSS